MVRISDICTPFSGFTPAASELFPSGKYPYFKVAEMNRETNQRVMTDTDAYVKESRKFFPKGAIVFPKNGAAIATNKKRILAQTDGLSEEQLLANFDKISKWCKEHIIGVRCISEKLHKILKYV